MPPINPVLACDHSTIVPWIAGVFQSFPRYFAECPIKAKVYYVNALGLGKQDRVCIDFDVNYTTSDYLVILRENMESPGIQLLLDKLRLSLRAKADRLPELTCVL